MCGCQLRLILVISAMISGAQLQTSFPQISFLGQTLHNNTYINILDHYGNISCVTEVGTCPGNEEEGFPVARAWLLPNGTRLNENTRKMFRGFEVSPAESRNCLLDLKFKAQNNPLLSGVYECVSLETETRSKESVFVGVYNDQRKVEVSFSGIDITNGSSPPFTLTCVSMNLPPTAVEWRLDGEGLTNISTTTVLDDRVTTQYTHKLTVTERKGGNYECIVTSFYFNLTVNPPIVDSATFTVHVGVAPSHIAVHQDGPTAVDVEIDADDQGSETVSYHIYYTGTTSGSVSVNASPSKHMHVPIKDLVNGGSYVISVVAKSVHLESAPVVAEYSPISLTPGAPELTLVSTTSDMVTFSWTVPRGTVVDSYELMWTIDGPQETTPTDSVSDTVRGSRSIPVRKSISPAPPIMACTCEQSTPVTSYTITGLDMYDNSSIEITVSAVNAGGRKESAPLIVHSDSLQSKSENENTDTNIGGIIGGVLGSFIIGLVIGGIVAGVTVYKMTQNNEKKSLPAPTSQPLPVKQIAVNGNIKQEESVLDIYVPPEDSSTIQNISYYPIGIPRVAVQNVTQPHNPDDGTYEYIS